MTRRVSTLLSALERRPVLAVFVIAFAARALLALAITIGWGGTLFLDDASYSRLAAAGADGTLSRLGAYPEWLYDHTATLLVPISGLYAVFGPVTLVGQLYVALLGAATAAITVRLVLEFGNRRTALVAGLLVALLPSQVLWSSIIMKDAAVWATLAALALVVAIGARSTGRRLLLCAAAVIALLALLGLLRRHTLEVALIAMVIATLFSERPWRFVRFGGAVAILVCLPLFFEMGPAGEPFVAGAVDPGLQRALNAQGAQTAVVQTEASDQGLRANIAYLPKGITVVALRPWPWEGDGSAGVDLARVEVLVWYPLVLFALLGATSIWSQRRALAFPVVCSGGILLMYGLAEGNLGTAFRHRGELVWTLAMLAALGIERVARRREAARPEQVARPLAAPHYASTRVGESSTAR